MKKSILLCFFYFIAPGLVFAQNEWKLNREGNGIKVYTQKLDDSKFKSVKVVCNIIGTIDKLVAILKNVDGNIKWVYNTKRTYSIKTVSNNEFIYYAETALPWPLTNRDVVIHMLFNKDSINKTLLVKATGLKDETATNKNIVRIPYFNGLWQVTNTDETHIHITYTLSVDPGGTIPAWAYNKFVSKGPYNTFNNLAALLKE
jgi:hypothetical protein